MKTITNNKMMIIFLLVCVSTLMLAEDSVRAKERELSKAVFYVQ